MTYLAFFARLFTVRHNEHFVPYYCNLIFALKRVSKSIEYKKLKIERSTDMISGFKYAQSNG